MIIINFTYGQLCNQLFFFAQFLAYAAETGQRVWFPGFRKNEGLFDYFVEDRRSYSKFVYLPFSAHWLQEATDLSLRRFFHKDGKLLHFIEFVIRRRLHIALDFPTESMFPEIEKDRHLTSPICLFEGWQFRVPLAFNKFAPHLRSIFRFREIDIKHSKTFLESQSKQIIIGVHIRQGDYSIHAPQWHFSPMQYHKWMTEVRQEMGSKVGFVVVSDGSLPDFNENWITRHQGNTIQDLCVLSHCHMVMGPPSTYNRWAAFMGQNPHLCLWNEKQQAKSEEFSIFKMTHDF
jgi:hypothetical protein